MISPVGISWILNSIIVPSSVCSARFLKVRPSCLVLVVPLTLWQQWQKHCTSPLKSAAKSVGQADGERAK